MVGPRPTRSTTAALMQIPKAKDIYQTKDRGSYRITYAYIILIVTNVSLFHHLYFPLLVFWGARGHALNSLKMIVSTKITVVRVEI